MKKNNRISTYRKKRDYSEHKLLSMYIEGNEISEILKECGISQTTLYNTLNRFKIARRNKKNNIKNRMVEMYQEGYKVSEILEVCESNVQTLYKTLRLTETPKRNRKIHLNAEEKKMILDQFLKNKSAEEIGENIGLSKTNIYDILGKRGIETDRGLKGRRIKKISEAEKQRRDGEIRKEYKKGTPLKDIKRKFGLKSDTSIYRVVKSNRNRYPTRQRSRRV